MKEEEDKNVSSESIQDFIGRPPIISSVSLLNGQVNKQQY